MKVVVVGAGIIGALCGYRLAQAGAEVIVVEAGRPASAASGNSFGWINASFHADAAHFRLRHEAMAAHRKLAGDLGTQAIAWPGCICWEQQGDALDAQYETLVALGYDVALLGREDVARLEPAIAPPSRALHFAAEGAVDLPRLAGDALRAAQDLGLRLICGVRASGIATMGGAVRGVETSAGTIAADHVVLAGGVGTSAIVEAMGIALPMLHRPGILMRSLPLPPLVSHILVTPEHEFRQLADGTILAPTEAAHQRIDSEAIVTDPAILAEAAAARLSDVLRTEIRWAEAALACRPVPGDGLPVIGAAGPAGLYLATMHSGATLAAVVAEIVAAEVSGTDPGRDRVGLVAPYRPGRFRG
ncbi:FAD-dependent oxidoreductase [Sulfitobacter sp. LCG007]